MDKLISADKLAQNFQRKIWYNKDEVLDAISDAQGVDEWISVKDRPPELRRAVLVYTPHHKNTWAATLHEDGQWYFWVPSTMQYDPEWYGPITHWMPLPEPPKEDDDGRPD